MDLEAVVGRYRVTDGAGFRLKDHDPGDTAGLDLDKEHARGLLQEGVQLLAELQDMLYAQDRWAVLLIFQAMDAAGKDSAIKHVMSGVNPQGVQVYTLQAALGGGARPRLPVARQPRAAGARPDRRLQPLLLRGGPGRPRPPDDPATRRSCRPSSSHRTIWGSAARTSRPSSATSPATAC